MRAKNLLWVIFPILLATLPIFLQSVSSQNDYYTGIGVSDYPHDKIIYVNSSQTVEIARLTNTGTLNFSVRSVWTPDHNSPDYQVELPNEFTLTIGESRLVTCTAFSSTIANFSGKVEFICDVTLPPNFTGNPSVPGHTTKVNFIFKEPTPLPIVTPYEYIRTVLYAYFKPILITGSIGGASATGALVFLHFRKKSADELEAGTVETEKQKAKKEYMKNYMREKRRKQREAKMQSPQ